MKTIFKDLSKAIGIYRKRLWSSCKAYTPKEGFNKCVDYASDEKLAKTLHTLQLPNTNKNLPLLENPESLKTDG